MNEQEFSDYLAGRDISVEKIAFTLSAVSDFDDFLQRSQTDLKEADIPLLQEYISRLVRKGSNTEDYLVAIARYCHFLRKNDFFIHIVGRINAVEVLPTLKNRLEERFGKEVKDMVFEDLELPPVGAPQEDYPSLTSTIVRRVECKLTPEQGRDLLTWNYHQIPLEAFKGHKERFEQADSLDTFLEHEHVRFIEELSRFMKEGKVWYEQEITPDVVEMVKGNQEISIGRREGDRIYVTKIPCEPDKFLREKDPRMRRYYACHCPLVRTSIRDGGPEVPSLFCYCSAGFTKLMFDVIFDQAVEIELMESVLTGSDRCRFSVKVPTEKMK